MSKSSNISKIMRRGFEILREDGAVELFKSFCLFVLSHMRIGRHYRLPFITLINHIENVIKHEAPAGPYTPIEVCPDDIIYKSGSGKQISKSKGLGQIKSGQWDENPSEFNSDPKYQGLIQRFEKGKDWKETKYVKIQYSNFEQYGKCSWGHSTPKDFIEHRCKYVDNLYRSMKNEGYIYSRNSLTNKDFFETNFGRKDGKLKPHQKLEPLILIGSSGECVLREGFHRASIAKILNLERIPVNVLCRHKQWQELRDEIHNNGLPENREDLRDHPDLQDVIDD